MSPRRPLPPPSAGIDLATALRGRYNHQGDDETATEESATPRTPRTPHTSKTDSPSSTSATSASPRTQSTPTAAVRRSWYMPSATADALSKAIEDEHFATRKPKAEILEALITTALAHHDEWHATLVAMPTADQE